MRRPKSIPSIGILALVLTPAVVTWGALSPQVKAQSEPEVQIALQFPPSPRGMGGPQSTAGGGVRGSSTAACIPEGATPLTALMPIHTPVKTGISNPSFFLYVPENTAEEAELAVVDEEGNDVYLSTFEVSPTAKVVQVTLPESTNLEVGKVYDWQFSLICNRSDRRADVYVLGQIERSELNDNVKAEIEEAEPIERAQLYVNEKMWSEAVSILADLRSTNPTEWQDLFNYVDLEEVSSDALTVETLEPTEN